MGAADGDAALAATYADLPAFVRGLRFDDLPQDVIVQAQRCLIDLAGTGAAGSRLPAASIARDYAASELCGRDRGARIAFDGRRAGLAGAAFAGASAIDALDAHDGHVLTKGHAGVAIHSGPKLLLYQEALPPGQTQKLLQCHTRPGHLLS